jgi:hypothetical protein
MRTLTFFLGQKGQKGPSGLDGVGSENIRSSLLDNPLFSGFLPNKTSDQNVSWSREDSATFVNRYGDLELLGGNEISNLLSYSEDFSQWTDPNNFWSIISSGESDPLGGNNARRITLNSSTFPSGTNVMGIPYSTTGTGLHTFSFWIRVESGIVEDVGVQFFTNNAVYTLNDPVTSNWQRISLTINVASTITNVFYINVYANAGVVFDIFGAQLSNDSQVIDYVKTTGSSIDIPNPERRWRENQFGYLIENEKTNFSVFSENLLAATWTITGGNITGFSGKDPKGGINTPTQVNFTNSNCILSNDGTFSSGETYTVSFWLYNNVGTVDSVLVSLAGGSPVPVNDIPKQGYQRIFVKCVAGGSGGVSFNMTTGSTLSKLQIFGVQAELGELSSYINTVDDIRVRSQDIVSLDYKDNFPLPSGDWTIIFDSVLEGEQSLTRYVFHNGLTGSSEFSLRFENEQAIFVNGFSISTFSLTTGKFEFVKSANQLFLYSNAELIDQQTVNQPSTAIGQTINIGCDLNQENQLEAFLSKLYVYDNPLTVDELRYFRGSDA